MKCAAKLAVVLLVAGLIPRGYADVCVYRAENIRHLSGFVVDQMNEPIAGAKITALRDSQPIADSTTDAKGNFNFDALPSGEYWLHFEASGFAGATYRVRLTRQKKFWNRVLRAELEVGMPGCGGVVAIIKAANRPPASSQP